MTMSNISQTQYEDAASLAPDRNAAAAHHAAGATVENVMDPRVYKIALGCWATLLAIFWITFWVSTNALFMVVVSTGYSIVFFGVPYLMSRQVRDRPTPARSLFTFLQEPFGTLDGAIPGWEALLQVIMVPVCLIGGGIAASIIISIARAAH